MEPIISGGVVVNALTQLINFHVIKLYGSEYSKPASLKSSTTPSPLSVFLAGTTTGTYIPGSPSDWRLALTNTILHLPITVFNPLRPDWDCTWREDATFPPFREQVNWELDMQRRAEVLVFYFGPATDAPNGLLELGLCLGVGVKEKKLVDVACHRELSR
ncbi:hypothetical protein VTK26DRAFT_393 [Humicola hyalothermophila]